jgi:molybdate transport system substrate-binding protein
VKSCLLVSFTALAIAIAIAIAGCSNGSAPSSSAPTAISAGAASPVVSVSPANMTIYGAASLSSVLAKVKTRYEADNPGTVLTISTDSSSALETKIEQGAPADVFLSADTANPQKLIDNGLADGGLVRFAGNLLAVIVPGGNPAGVKTPADLANKGIKVIAAGDTVPITKYANQLVANLARQPGYPADFVARYTANIVSKQDNVSAVVAQISLGEGDAAIAYVTDAKTTTKVAIVDVPAAANVPATYAGVVVKGTPNPDAAWAFLAWLAGPEGQAILASAGFLSASRK